MSRARAVAVLLAASAVAAAGLVVVLLRAGTTAPPRPPLEPARPESSALRVLHQWDARRANAWAAGSSSRLRALYVEGSGAGVTDVRLLHDYRTRGYRVTGLRMQVLALRVLERRDDRWRLEVTDRLAAGEAVRGTERVRLPRGAARTRRVTLMRRSDGGWRVASVRAGAGSLSAEQR